MKEVLEGELGPPERRTETLEEVKESTQGSTVPKKRPHNLELVTTPTGMFLSSCADGFLLQGSLDVLVHSTNMIFKVCIRMVCVRF